VRKHLDPRTDKKAPIRVEVDGRVFDSLANFGDEVLSAISEIIVEFKNMVVRFLKRH